MENDNFYCPFKIGLTNLDSRMLDRHFPGPCDESTTRRRPLFSIILVSREPGTPISSDRGRLEVMVYAKMLEENMELRMRDFR